MSSVARKTDEQLVAWAHRLRLTHTRDHLQSLLETAMAAQMAPRAVLELIFKSEVEARDKNRTMLGLLSAHFPKKYLLEDFDFDAQPGLRRGLIDELAKLEWVQTGENVVFIGPSGVGKTHLAVGLGVRYVQNGGTVRFYSAASLLALLEKAVREGNLSQKLAEINKPRLLIIDEFGYLPCPASSGNLLFQLIEKRYEHKSVIVTSNRNPSDWGVILGDEVLAQVILDRLLHHALAVPIFGESYRVRSNPLINRED